MAYTVTTLNNAGAGSLRLGLITAGITNISFDPTLVGGTITLLSEIPVSKDVVVNGFPNPADITITVDASVNARIFNLSGPGPFTISMSGMTLTGGAVIGANNGGCVFVGTGVTYTLNNAIVTNNSAVNNGGAFQVAAGAVCNLTNCNISLNAAGPTGGLGGAIRNLGTTTITNCTMVGNRAATAGGAISNNGILTIIYSTLTQNSSLDLADTAGDGLDSTAGPVIISNSTFTENPTTGTQNSITNNAGTIRLENSTIHNTLNSEIVRNNATLNYTNSVIDILIGSANSLGGNWITTIQGNPFLGPLQSNGGPTDTMLPATGSPLIDAGNVATVTSTTDQRGLPRQSPPGSVDIGSVEVQQGPIVCYSGESMILTKNTVTGEIKEIAAKKVIPGIYFVYDVKTQMFVDIKYNIVSGTITRFMKLKKNLIAENKPNADLFITSGHKICIGDKIIKAGKIPGATRSRVKPVMVYSICTENDSIIRVNGLDVITWGLKSWDKYSKEHNISWINNQLSTTIESIN